MATAAISTQGVQLQRNNVLIAEITNFNGPSETARQVDVTSLDSTSREYISGLRDGGEVSFDMNLVPGDTAQQGLRADLAARTVQSFSIVLTDAGACTITFSALVTQFSIRGGVDDRVTASCSLKITGDVTYTP